MHHEKFNMNSSGVFLFVFAVRLLYEKHKRIKNG